MKRSRGRGRRQQNPVNRSYDSNGPDVRVRGTASQVYEKYQTLARDAMSAGDRVMAENYQQHAEHYYRILLSIQPPAAEDDREAGNGEANGRAEAEPANGHEGGNGQDASGEPLVLTRDAADEDEKPKKSRRRGPLGKKPAGKNGNGAAEEAAAEAPAEAAVEATAEAAADTGEAAAAD